MFWRSVISQQFLKISLSDRILRMQCTRYAQICATCACRICANMHGSVQAFCTDVCEYMHGCVQIYARMCANICTDVCKYMHGCVRIHARMCASICTVVCIKPLRPQDRIYISERRELPLYTNVCDLFARMCVLNLWDPRTGSIYQRGGSYLYTQMCAIFLHGCVY